MNAFLALLPSHYSRSSFVLVRFALGFVIMVIAVEEQHSSVHSFSALSSPSPVSSSSTSLSSSPLHHRRGHYHHHNHHGRHGSSPLRWQFRTSASATSLWTHNHEQEEPSEASQDVQPLLLKATPSSTTTTDEPLQLESKIKSLQQENEALRKSMQALQQENALLHKQHNKIVIETFEGEFSGHAALAEGDEQAMEEFCAQYDDDDDACPIEPAVTFGEALRDRAVWLVGLLVLQSASGIILAHNEALLEKHPVIVYFLTMLVGAGGNAGNQASVRVIRGLALGTLNSQTVNQFLVREFKMAASLSCLLSVAGFVRAAVFRTPFPETCAVTTALFMIVFSSIILGAILPLFLKRIGIDPAHSSTTIQVVMDILGVVLAVTVSTLILDSPIGALVINRLGGGRF